MNWAEPSPADARCTALHSVAMTYGFDHPPAVVYAGLMQNYFQPELKKRVEERTEHQINFVEGYSGSIVAEPLPGQIIFLA